MLDVHDLRCSPVGEPPVSSVSLTVSRGECVVIFGPNGAGKSTLCRCLAGLYPRQSGEIRLDGIALPAAPWDVVGKGLFVVLKGRRVFPELTVEENLAASPCAWASGNPRGRIDAIFDLFPELGARRRQRGGSLSGGEQQMVALGRAFIAMPQVLVLDEPTLGLAPRVISDVKRALNLIRMSGVGVLVAEENEQRLSDVADRSYLMIGGQFASKSVQNTCPHPNAEQSRGIEVERSAATTLATDR